MSKTKKSNGRRGRPTKEQSELHRTHVILKQTTDKLEEMCAKCDEQAAEIARLKAVLVVALGLGGRS